MKQRTLAIQRDKPLRELSSFRIGGPAKYLIEISTLQQAEEALSFCKESKIPFFVLGRGSNCLFDDRGLNGCLILNRIESCRIEPGGKVAAGAGCSFSHLGIKTSRERLSGLEFACGIPGTVGGAVYMNAGANGYETKDALLSALALYPDGSLRRYPRDQLGLSYRSSRFQEEEALILEAEFLLNPDSEAQARQRELFLRRKERQPLNLPSAGCIFRNPKGFSSGALIEEAGLKGARIGGAEVSTLHANFIVNRGGATSKDVLQLIHLLKEEIGKRAGSPPELEIRCVPYELEGGQ